MLEIEHLSVGYGGRKVLKDVSFQLEKGFHVLLGRNGSGKTTLFRALAGTLCPEEGKIILNGENLRIMSARERARRLSAVLGTHQTLTGLSGMDLCEMAFYATGGLFDRPGRSEKETIRTNAALLGIEPLLERSLETLSAGERQMTELLAAMCQDTPLMLLDEPTSALDYNRTHDFLKKAKKLSETKLLLATLHDPSLALRYADSMLFLREGRIACKLTPAQSDESEAENKLRLLYPAIRVLRIGGTLTVL